MESETTLQDLNSTPSNQHKWVTFLKLRCEFHIQICISNSQKYYTRKRIPTHKNICMWIFFSFHIRMTQSLRKCIARRALIHTNLVSIKTQIIAIFLTCLYFNNLITRLNTIRCIILLVSLFHDALESVSGSAAITWSIRRWRWTW